MVMDSNWVFIVCIVDDGSPPRPPLFCVRSELALEDLNRPPILSSLPSSLARDVDKKDSAGKNGAGGKRRGGCLLNTTI